MTAIAVFTVDTVPVVIGDVLFSTEGDAGYSIKLPGSGAKSDDFARSRGLKYFPAALSQKVTIINKNLTVACAGDAETGLAFVELLREDKELNNNPSYERLEEIVRSFEHDHETQFSFVYLYKDKKVVATSGGGDAKKVNIGGYKGLVVAGSGADAIVDALTGSTTTFSHWEMPDGLKAQHRINQLLCRLWSLDITSERNIELGFGGGYEIGTFGDDSEAIKVGDIVFAHVSAFHRAEGVMIGLNTRFSKVDYQDDNLVVRVMDANRDPNKPGTKNNPIDLGEDLQIGSIVTRGTIIPPFGVNPAEVTIDYERLERLPDFNAKYLNVLVTATAKNGKQMSTVFSEIRPQRNCSIEFTDERIFITPKLWKSIVEHIQEFLVENESTDGGLTSTDLREAVREAIQKTDRGKAD